MGYQPRPKPVYSNHVTDPEYNYWRDWFSSTPCLLLTMAVGVGMAAAGAMNIWWLTGFGLLLGAQGLVKQHYWPVDQQVYLSARPPTGRGQSNKATRKNAMAAASALDEPARKGEVMYNLTSGGAIMFNGEEWVEAEDAKPQPPPTRFVRG